MAKKRAARKPDELKAVSFEDAVERLEEVVEDLEGRQMGLDESLARFEEGVKLVRHANKVLSEAERRLVLLTGVDEHGNPIEQELAEDGMVSDTSAPGRTTRDAWADEDEDDADI